MASARATPGHSRSRAWLTSWALVLLFLASLPAVTPRLYASDEIQYFAYLRSLWFDQDLAFDNEYRYFHDRGIARAYGFEETFLVLKTETGRRFNFATIGCALLWAPFYAGADVTVRALRAAGSPIAADGFSAPYIAAVAYGSAFYGFLAVLLSIRAARLLVGRVRSGYLAGLVVWLGTPLVFYMYVAPGMAHACSAFAVAVFVNVWLAVRGDWSRRGCVALGAAAALVVMVRGKDVFFVVGPALDFVWRLKDDLAGGWSAAVGRRLRNAYVTLESNPFIVPIVKRADIWAFGAVLFEMLTAKKPFPGDDISQTLARVIDRDPDWDALPKTLPSHLDTYLRRCLQKDSRQRVRDMGDVRLALEGAFETGDVGRLSVGQPKGSWKQSMGWAVSAVLGLAAGLVLWGGIGASVDQTVTRFSLITAGQLPLARTR